MVTDPSCYHLFSRPGIQDSQQLDPDLSSRSARARERFAKRSSGKPLGRSRDILKPQAAHARSCSPVVEA
jgi:hypothetical protein